MRRRAIRIFVILLLGAIVTYAAAWGCTIRWIKFGPSQISRSLDPDRFSRGEVQAVWARLAPPGWVGEPMAARQDLDIGLRRLSADAGRWTIVAGRGQPATTIKYYVHESAAGWPLLALRFVTRVDNSSESRTFHGRLRVPVKMGAVRAIYLPFLPMWPGFAINTVFYAVVLWLLFACPFVMRRWRRIRRGLCPKCAYDLRGTPRGAATACPECGAPHTMARLA